jgi:hypothetical protein
MKKSLTYFLSITLLLFTACSKNSDNKPTTIDATTVSMHYDGTHQFSVTNTSSLSWTSSDATVGTISSSGLFTAKKIGTTTIKGVSGNTSAQSTVTVTPYSTMCQEPYFILGASKATIEGKENRLLYGSSSTGLLFTGENSKLRYAEYVFDNTGLTETALLLANTTDVVNEASIFFKERYTLLGTDGTVIYFTGNNNLVIGLTVDNTLGFVAIYFISTTTPTTNSLKQLNSLRLDAIQSLKKNVIQ